MLKRRLSTLRPRNLAAFSFLTVNLTTGGLPMVTESIVISRDVGVGESAGGGVGSGGGGAGLGDEPPPPPHPPREAVTTTMAAKISLAQSNAAFNRFMTHLPVLFILHACAHAPAPVRLYLCHVSIMCALIHINNNGPEQFGCYAVNYRIDKPLEGDFPEDIDYYHCQFDAISVLRYSSRIEYGGWLLPRCE